MEQNICNKCGRPMQYNTEPKCNYNDCCKEEYCGCKLGRIKEMEPTCDSTAVIPSITVESVEGITNLANCLVHVEDINTTFYVDDKHRVMITWAGPVNIPGYDMENNPNGYRDQIVTDIEKGLAVIYDKHGKGYTFGIYDSLDSEGAVTQAINDKLDEMATDGTLESIIATYMNDVAHIFDTVADMKASTELVDGSYARTLGFHTINDGGGALYKITDTGTPNEMDIIAIGSLNASLIRTEGINVKQYGAYGDNAHDDTTYLQRAISASYHSTIYVPAGNYWVYTPINITSSVNIIGEGFYSNLIKKDTSAYNESINYLNNPFDFNDYPSIINGIFPTDSNLNYMNIKGLRFSKDSNITTSIHGIIAPHLAYSTIENCRFGNCFNSIILGGWNNTVKKCDFFSGEHAVEVVDQSPCNNILITECYAKECFFRLRHGSGSSIKNTHVDSVGTPFIFIDCSEVTIESCSTEVWAKNINANNSYVNVYNCNLELHKKDRYSCFIEATNGAIVNVNSSLIRYDDYETPGEYPTSTDLLVNSGASKIYINNSKISVPFTYTDSLSGKGLNKINDYINSNVFTENSVTKKYVSIDSNKVEIGRFAWAYGSALQIKVKGYGQHDYASINIDAIISTLNRGSGSRIITVDDNTVVASNLGTWTASITAEYEADNTLVVYYNQSNTWGLDIEIEIEYNKATV